MAKSIVSRITVNKIDALGASEYLIDKTFTKSINEDTGIMDLISPNNWTDQAITLPPSFSTNDYLFIYSEDQDISIKLAGGGTAILIPAGGFFIAPGAYTSILITTTAISKIKIIAAETA